MGAAPAWFAARGHDARATGSPLRVVFFGLFTPLQGATVVGEAIGCLAGSPGIEFTMIGTGQDYPACRQLAGGNARVTWRDWVDADLLPAMVADHDVCLGIFGTTPKAMRVVPNKVYQGAAAGCAVVTSDTPPQRRALGEAALFVEGGSAAALVEALQALAADRTRAASLQQAARQRSSQCFTPEVIVRPLRRALAARLESAGR